MRQQVSFLTQSRFYSPAFNAAIFDGSFRIYFSQLQESMALKIYFAAQQRLKNTVEAVRDAFRGEESNVFVMLYPSTESFQMSFEGSSVEEDVVVDRLGSDYIVGVRGPITDGDCDRILAALSDQLSVCSPEREIEA